MPYHYFVKYFILHAVLLWPSLGQFTVTVNIGENVVIQVVGAPQNLNMVWEKQGHQIQDFKVVQNVWQQATYTINFATEEHAGVYQIYWSGLKHRGVYIRLIVRGMLINAALSKKFTSFYIDKNICHCAGIR